MEAKKEQDKRTESFLIYLTKKELESIRRFTENQGLSLSAFSRFLILKNLNNCEVTKKEGE